MNFKGINIAFLWLIGLNSLLVGRAIEHIRWDPPYRAILWNEDILKVFIESILGLNWDVLLTTPEYSNQIQTVIKLCGYFILITLLVFNYYYIVKKVTKFRLLIPIQFILLIYAFCFWLDKGRTAGLFLELFIVTGYIPAWYIYSKNKSNIFKNFTTIIIAATFIGHGLYAINFYPAPREFVEMFVESFQMEQPLAIQLLFVFGLLDILCAVLLFFPSIILKKYALLYMAIWGFITALARLTSYVYIDFFTANLVQWFWEFLIRTPHFILPLILYKHYQKASAVQLKTTYLSFVVVVITFISSCSTNQKDKNKTPVNAPSLSKTYIIKSDAEARQLIEPIIIKYRKQNPDFKVSIEIIERNEINPIQVEHCDIVVIASPYPQNINLKDYDTLIATIDTLIFITHKNNSPFSIRAKKLDETYTLFFSKQMNSFISTPVNSPDLLLLFGSTKREEIVNKSSKSSNDYNTIIQWAIEDKNLIGWTSIKNYTKYKDNLTSLSVINHNTNTPIFLSREIIIYSKNEIQDLELLKFTKEIRNTF